MTATVNSRWGLITGASAGIGAAFAEELAGRGYNLVLVARRADRLEALAQTLNAKHGIATRIVALDLADVPAPERLFAETEAAGIALHFLVNNAGYCVPGSLIIQHCEKRSNFMH